MFLTPSTLTFPSETQENFQTMKEVTITVKLLLEDDQPSCDWVYESIYEQLNHDAGEAILEYNDDEPVVKLGMTDYGVRFNLVDEKSRQEMYQRADWAGGYLYAR